MIAMCEVADAIGMSKHLQGIGVGSAALGQTMTDRETERDPRRLTAQEETVRLEFAIVHGRVVDRSLSVLERALR
jgi:hypothetical protein